MCELIWDYPCVLFSVWCRIYVYEFMKDVWCTWFSVRCITYVYVSLDDASYGKPVPGVESHYEFCCYFPQNVCTLHALESSIFIQFLFRLLRSSDLEFLTTLSYNLGTEGVPKSQNIVFTFGYNSGWKKNKILTSKLY